MDSNRRLVQTATTELADDDTGFFSLESKSMVTGPCHECLHISPVDAHRLPAQPASWPRIHRLAVRSNTTDASQLTFDPSGLVGTSHLGQKLSVEVFACRRCLYVISLMGCKTTPEGGE